MATADRLDIDRVLQDPQCRIVVCCGSGGVGKTTTAAALALRAAEHGRSMEEEARAILRRVMTEDSSPRDLAAAISEAGALGTMP